MHLEGEKHYYEAKTSRDHCHMACFGCGAIIEYASSIFERLKSEMARLGDFRIEVVRLEVGGYCKRCRRLRDRDADCRAGRRRVTLAMGYRFSKTDPAACSTWASVSGATNWAMVHSWPKGSFRRP